MPKIVADKSEWIKLGFELFAEQGISGVVVEKMAERLKCNRSSFYWHFNSKKEFIYQIINTWIESDTNEIITLTERVESPENKLKTLVEVVFKEDPYIDFVFHLKRYALKNKNIQKIIDEIDHRRISYVFSILKDLGLTEAESSIKAQIFYKYLIGYHEMIRYKKQDKNYVEQVYEELKHFLPNINL